MIDWGGMAVVGAVTAVEVVEAGSAVASAAA